MDGTENTHDGNQKFTRIDLDRESWVDRCVRLPDVAKFDGDKFEELWSAHPAELGTVKLYGRDVDTPRWQQSYLKPYKFSGQMHAALPLPDAVGRLYNWVRTVNPDVNQCLINWYKDGKHYIGAHSDDESQLKENSDIFSFSYGAERMFYIHRKPKGDVIHKISMPHNSLIVMRGRTQKKFKHSVPKTAKISGRRINITFRCFK